MSTEGKVKVVVRSRKFPVATAEMSQPVYSNSGVFTGMTSARFVVYDTSLDSESRKAIEEGHRLSRRLGLDLEVVDASRSGLFRRLLSYLGLTGPGRPVFVVAPPSPGCETFPQNVAQGH